MRQLKPAWGNWLALCREVGVTTSLDTNWDPEERWEGVLELLPMIDVFLPNEAEALAVTKEADVVSAARALAQYGPLVVVKRGENGALALQRESIYGNFARPSLRFGQVALWTRQVRETILMRAFCAHGSAMPASTIASLWRTDAQFQALNLPAELQVRSAIRRCVEGIW